MTENMENDFFYHFNKALVEFKSLQDFFVSKDKSIEKCRSYAIKACHMVHSPISNLIESYFFFSDVKYKSDNLFSLAAKINDRIDEENLGDSFYIKPQKEQTSNEQHNAKITFYIDEFSQIIKRFISRPKVEDLFEQLDLISTLNEPEDLIECLQKHLDDSKELFTSICASISKEISTDKEKKEKPKDYVTQYVNKWVNRTVTYFDIQLHTTVNYWEHLLDMDLDSDEFELIEQHQHKLFDERVAFETMRRINDLKEIEEPRRTEAILNQIKIIEQFFQGDTSEILLKRLEQSMGLTIFDDVLIAYDKLLTSEYYCYTDKIIFNFEKYRFHTIDFIAHSLYAYLKELKVIISKPVSKIEKTVKAKQKSIKHSFGFIGNQEELQQVIQQLAWRVNLLMDENQVEEMVTLLVSTDFKSSNIEIQLGCETIQFAYITKKLSKSFKSLRPVFIEASKAFFSKSNNKQIFARDLHGKQDAEVKSKEEIDRIISRMK